MPGCLPGTSSTCPDSRIRPYISGSPLTTKAGTRPLPGDSLDNTEGDFGDCEVGAGATIGQDTLRPLTSRTLPVVPTSRRHWPLCVLSNGVIVGQPSSSAVVPGITDRSATSIYRAGHNVTCGEVCSLLSSGSVCPAHVYRLLPIEALGSPPSAGPKSRLVSIMQSFLILPSIDINR